MLLLGRTNDQALVGNSALKNKTPARIAPQLHRPSIPSTNPQKTILFSCAPVLAGRFVCAPRRPDSVHRIKPQTNSVRLSSLTRVNQETLRGCQVHTRARDQSPSAPSTAQGKLKQNIHAESASKQLFVALFLKRKGKHSQEGTTWEKRLQTEIT